MDTRVLVHVDLAGVPTRVGRLWIRVRGGRESASFEYDRAWVEHPLHFALEPALRIGPGPYHVRGRLFGSIGDSAPDRWGRVLLRRAEVRRARLEGRAPRTLFESDFLLRVDDKVRTGALRFSTAGDGPFLAEPGEMRVPPLVDLRRLMSASRRVLRRRERDDDLRLLIGPGSSLGGARPKTAARDNDGGLAIAKFPGTEDDRDIVLWEGVALALARRAGIRVPEWRMESVAGRRLLILRRFDREGNHRVPFLSAMSMLDARDNDPRSYLELADSLRHHGAAARSDLAELWRRVVFSILISNTDDHLRNHGFLYEIGQGWRLSPAYDLNPVPTDVGPRVLTTYIDEHDGTASLESALGTAEYYGLNLDQAKQIAGAAGRAVAAWREEAARLGGSGRETDRMESAFVHEDLARALRFNAPGSTSVSRG